MTSAATARAGFCRLRAFRAAGCGKWAVQWPCRRISLRRWPQVPEAAPRPHAIEAFLKAQHLARVDFDICGLTLKTTRGLVNHGK